MADGTGPFVLVLNMFFASTIGFDITGYRYFVREFVSSDSQADYGVPSFEEKWIEQPLDHFSATVENTFKLRYLERLDLFKAGGPVYIFIGGEGEVYPSFLNVGTMFELANETNGALYTLEHRFYGKSKPANWSNIDTLKYLSSKQALADIANFIEAIKSNETFNSSKVVLVGGSYSANLAAWMKFKYADSVDVALASSGPVLAKKDFFEYLEVVSDNYEQYGTENCMDMIKEIFDNYEKLLSNAEGIEKLKKKENICADIDMADSLNQQLFILDQTSVFMGRSQYGSVDTIKSHCEFIANTSRIVLPTEHNDFMLGIRGEDCNGYSFDDLVESVKKNDAFFAWYFQTCTEFGYYQTGSSENQPFTNIVTGKLFYELCEALFGEEFDERKVDAGVNETNEMFGGLRPNVTHVVFSNGDMDPWHRLSVIEDISYDAPAVVIARSSHCKDLLPNKKDDHEELLEAKKHIKYVIKTWLGEVEKF